MNKLTSLILLASISFQIQALSITDATSALETATADSLIYSAKGIGIPIYSLCILVPPVEPAQQAICAAKYATYISLLTTLADGNLTPSSFSPYVSSPYDICKFQIATFVFSDPAMQPSCNTL